MRVCYVIVMFFGVVLVLFGWLFDVVLYGLLVIRLGADVFPMAQRVPEVYPEVYPKYTPKYTPELKTQPHDHGGDVIWKLFDVILMCFFVNFMFCLCQFDLMLILLDMILVLI